MEPKLIGYAIDTDDDWADGAAESAEKHRDKNGAYKQGTLFMIVCFLPTKTLQSRIKRCKYIKQYAGCTHDIDIYSQEDMDKALRQDRHPSWAVGDTKKHHCHVFLRCHRVRLDTLANALGIPVNHIQYVKSTYGVLCYLTHKGWEEKHQYDDNDVWSNYDWISERDGAKHVDELDVILAQVDAGVITKTNVAQMLTIGQYVKYKAKLQDAFWYYDQTHKHDKNTRVCMYVTSGVAGSGKSTLAEMLARLIASKHGWDYCFGGNGKDIWGDYQGEEIIILDDKSFGDLSRDNWLNTFDRFVKGSMDSRFKNKNAVNVRLIIVTNILPFADNVGKIKDLSADEDKSQFTRRFQLVADVQETVITLYKYDSSTKDYVVHDKMVNYLTAYIRKAGQESFEGLIDEIVGAVHKLQDEAKKRLDDDDIQRDQQGQIDELKELVNSAIDVEIK